MADAYMLAIERAYPNMTDEERGDFEERFHNGDATQEEEKRVNDELAKITRADIGRPPLPRPAALSIDQPLDVPLNPAEEPERFPMR